MTLKTKNFSKWLHCYRCSYMVKNGVIYLTLADKKYPQKLAFLYLNEVQEAFQSELKNTYGSGNVDFLSKIEAIDN